MEMPAESPAEIALSKTFSKKFPEMRCLFGRRARKNEGTPGKHPDQRHLNWKYRVGLRDKDIENGKHG